MTNRKEIDDGAERIHIREIVGERLKCVGEKKTYSNIVPPKFQRENYKMKTKE